MSQKNRYFKGAHHVGIVVSNFESSLEWYSKKLGFSLISQANIEDAGLKIGFMQSGDFKLELFESRESVQMCAEQQELSTSLKRQGYAHFAFATEDCDATWEWLQSLGVELHVPPTINLDLGAKYCFIKDPDGILIEFIEDI